MDLYILRHGKAQDRRNIPSDRRRSLTVVGRQEMEETARSLRELQVRPDHIITSPLDRARQTARIVAKRLGVRPLIEWDELKPEGDLAGLYRRLSEFGPDSTVLLVGHEPQLSCLISGIITAGGGGHCRITLKKAGLARLTISSTAPERFSGDLNWLIAPRLFKKLSK